MGGCFSSRSELTTEGKRKWTINRSSLRGKSDKSTTRTASVTGGSKILKGVSQLGCRRTPVARSLRSQSWSRQCTHLSSLLDDAVLQPRRVYCRGRESRCSLQASHPVCVHVPGLQCLDRRDAGQDESGCGNSSRQPHTDLQELCDLLPAPLVPQGRGSRRLCMFSALCHPVADS